MPLLKMESFIDKFPKENLYTQVFVSHGILLSNSWKALNLLEFECLSQGFQRSKLPLNELTHPMCDSINLTQKHGDSHILPQ